MEKSWLNEFSLRPRAELSGASRLWDVEKSHQCLDGEKKHSVITTHTGMLIFFLSRLPMTIHCSNFVFLLFFLLPLPMYSILREKYRTHSLRFDTKVPAVFFYILQLLLAYFTAWSVRNVMDEWLSSSMQGSLYHVLFVLGLCKQNSAIHELLHLFIRLLFTKSQEPNDLETSSWN